MNTKEWNVRFKGHEIMFRNQWSWEGTTIEELFIDGKSVKKIEKDMINGKMKDSVQGSFEFQLEDEVIIILAGQKWHLCGVSAQIYANGKKIGGDKILFFGDKETKKRIQSFK